MFVAATGKEVEIICLPRDWSGNSVGLAFVKFSASETLAEVFGLSGQELMGR
jgi:hypothetical protein